MSKKVLLAVDINCEPDPDNLRMQRAIVALREIIDLDPKQVAVLSHYGRPERAESRYSLKQHANIFAQALGVDVSLISEPNTASDASVGLFENLRFWDWQGGSIANQLKNRFDFLVYDAFGLAHRDEPYTTGLIKAFEDRVSMGSGMRLDIKSLDEFINAELPKILILGGLKTGDKLPVLDALLPVLDEVWLVGATANAFYKAKGYRIGSSVVNLKDAKDKEISTDLIKKYLENPKIQLPKQVIVSALSDADHEKTELDITKASVPDDLAIVDSSPASFGDLELTGKAAFWNGNAGITEKGYQDGTVAIAKRLGEASFSMVGGGDTTAWLAKQPGLANKFTHISSGGGAALEYLANKGSLPVLDVLLSK